MGPVQEGNPEVWPTLDSITHDGNGHIVYSRKIENSEASCSMVSNGDITVVSPLDYNYWRNGLADHPDENFTSTLLSWMVHGAPTWYDGPQKPRICANWPSAWQYHSEVSETLQKDKRRHRMVGPFPQPPFENMVCNPMGAFRKKNSSKVRTIHDLSFPPRESVNDHIDPEKCSLKYTTVENVVEKCMELKKQSGGQMIYCAKLDLSEAFKHIIVNPHEWHLLGCTWKDTPPDNPRAKPNEMRWSGVTDPQMDYYCGTVLQFGMRSAPRVFDMFGAGLQYLMVKNGASNLDRYMDDYITYQIGKQKADGSLTIMLDTCGLSGMEAQDSKTVWGTPIIEFLGIIMDHIHGQLMISSERLTEIKTILAEWRFKTKCTKRQLLSLLGKLMFCCKVIRCGKTFTHRIIQLVKGTRYLHYRIRLNSAARADIEWWLQCIDTHNGISYYPTQWSSSDLLHLYTDASDIAVAGVYQKQWFYRCFVGKYAIFRDKPIVYKEMLALLMAVATFGSQLAGQRIVLHVDNQAVCFTINAGYSKNSDLMTLIREMYHLLAYYSMEVKALYINTKLNILADRLSRLDVQGFFLHEPDAEKCMTWPESVVIDGVIY